jgi:2-iminobutanoate/2-iminopropanoate deaminase
MAEPLFHVFAGGPRFVAPYSHAVEIDGWIFLTGQLPLDDTGSVPETIEKQTELTFANLRYILEKCGVTLANVISVRVYLSNFEAHYERMNKIYSSIFPKGRYPARTCIGVTRLARGCHIEIDMVAKRP